MQAIRYCLDPEVEHEDVDESHDREAEGNEERGVVEEWCGCGPRKHVREEVPDVGQPVPQEECLVSGRGHKAGVVPDMAQDRSEWKAGQIESNRTVYSEPRKMKPLGCPAKILLVRRVING